MKTQKGVCAVTRFNFAIEVAHIRSWAKCRGTKAEWDPKNGLLLSASFHSSFDKGEWCPELVKKVYIVRLGEKLLKGSMAKWEGSILGKSPEKFASLISRTFMNERFHQFLKKNPTVKRTKK